MSIQEHVILVNDQGKVIGTLEKYARTRHTPRYTWPSLHGCLTLTENV